MDNIYRVFYKNNHGVKKFTALTNLEDAKTTAKILNGKIFIRLSN